MNCGYNDGLHKQNGGITPTIMGYNGIKWETPIQQYDNWMCLKMQSHQILRQSCCKEKDALKHVILDILVNG